MTLKDFLKRGFKTFLALAGLVWLFPGFSVSQEIWALPLAALVLTGINILVKPILKLILLPLNLLSFGMFRWVINVLSLFLLTLFVDQVSFQPFVFPGFSELGINLPSINFSSLGSLITASFLVTLIRKTIGWLLRNG